MKPSILPFYVLDPAAIRPPPPKKADDGSTAIESSCAGIFGCILILGHRGVDFVCPGQNPSLKVQEFLESGCLQKLDGISGALAAARLTSLKAAIAKVEKPGASRKDAADLKSIGDTLDKDAAKAKSATDAGRMRALAAILKHH